MNKILYIAAILLLSITFGCEEDRDPKSWDENVVNLDASFKDVSSVTGIPNSYEFSNNTKGLSYIEWNLGDGKTVREESGIIIYTVDGEYQPILTAVNGNRVSKKTFDKITVKAEQLISVKDISESGVAGKENLRQLMINSDPSTVFENSKWDFGNGEWVETSTTDTIIRYLEAGDYNVKFEATVQGAMLSAETTVSIENGEIKKQDVSFLDFENTTPFAGSWGEANGDTKLLNEYNPNTNPYAFGGSNVLVMGKSGGWWTEARYSLNGVSMDFADEYSEVAFRIYLEDKTINIGGVDYPFNMSEEERLIKIGLSTSDSWDGRVEVEKTVDATGQWVDISFDFSDKDFSGDKITASDIKHLWVMFSHGKGTSGVIYIDDMVLKRSYPGITIH
ncbi:hypothetical protein K5X82_16960 [Halosquirtibacter xylanolyticus]|uniref:PKD domain-containing protein n=1 Tax=Halosquirtibacter xylanolyticus TaxID=3374599 RepID=UPI003748ECEA|nr:hypothetical protein K5X82_16960 [Prolixibacteraceae bacterium]